MKPLTVIATADIHGRFTDRLPAVKNYVDRTRQEGPVILLDAGDFFTGTVEADYANFGESGQGHRGAQQAVDLGYDAMVPGNHDEELPEGIKSRISEVLKNILVTEGIKIIDRGGFRTGIVCIPLQSNIELLKSKSDRLLREVGNCDFKIGLIHHGPADCVGLEGYDAIFCGHEHKKTGIFRKVNCLIINPGPRANGIARVTLPSRGAKIVKLRHSSVSYTAEIERYGATVLTSNPPQRVDALIAEALRKAFPKSTQTLTDEDDTPVSGSVTLTNSYRLLPYDDYPILIDGYIATTHYYIERHMPGAKILASAPLPLRHYISE